MGKGEDKKSWYVRTINIRPYFLEEGKKRRRQVELINTSFGRQASINVNKDEYSRRIADAVWKGTWFLVALPRSLVGKQVPVRVPGS